MIAGSLFAPHLDILPAPQRRLWSELISVPPEFTLYGGTAIALHLGHRESLDFNFFGANGFDPDRLAKGIPFLSGADIVQRQADTLTARVDRGGAVLISFFATPGMGKIAEPVLASEIGLKIAPLIDLAGMKADVVQKRAEAKDYIDIDALISAGVGLPYALAAAKLIQGPSFNPQITLKALSYFGDGNLSSLAPDLKRRLQEAVLAVDLHELPFFEIANPVDPQGGRTS
jgi:hypothetical protein